MRRDVTLEIDLPCQPADVWRALTDPTALSEWLMPVAGFTAMVGQRFQLRAKPMPGWDGVIEAEVLDAEGPHRLAYSWKGSQMRSTTTVRWTLTPLPDGGSTRLSLHHQGFEGASGALMAVMHRAGWRKFVTRRLPSYLAAHAGAAGPDSSA
ncbi:SRPBCC family protein [Nonomuraea sp. SYSU D8015]|uniref:SRPBCC family protein n=1 Tax=Nonomuraea sp. SYSU D8015 TaxID=2593644 RepID=UPI0016612C5C|nr:SRPBCC domain-containing protein [Nonomuraea sp. SYSU D8015]